MERALVVAKNHSLTRCMRNNYIKIAKELCYPEEVYIKLKNAKTVYEAERILHWARNNS